VKRPATPNAPSKRARVDAKSKPKTLSGGVIDLCDDDDGDDGNDDDETRNDDDRSEVTLNAEDDAARMYAHSRLLSGRKCA
jgi:hypothetical protein